MTFRSRSTPQPKSTPKRFSLTGESLFVAQGGRVTELAARYNLPAMYCYSKVVDLGDLMAYDVSYPDVIRRAAYVDRILKGVKVSDLPVECRERPDT
jgi:putative ABC transport system substrate-binding protein